MTHRLKLTAISNLVCGVATLVTGESLVSAGVTTVRPVGGTLSVAVDRLGTSVLLNVQPPEIRDVDVVLPVPADYTPSLERSEPWPGGPKDRPTSVGISPRHDEQGTLVLGGLYRQILAETVRVRRDGDDTPRTADQDFRYQPDWGCIAALNGGLGEPGQDKMRVSYAYATQRIDLVEVDAAGTVQIKTGRPAMVCPQLPQTDAGMTALAGIYVAPWRRDGKFVVTQDDIFPISGKTSVQVEHVDRLRKSQGRLERGEELKVAIIGDSVALGAEAGNWWDDLWTDANTSFASRFVVGLRRAFPAATVTPLHAVKGGRTVKAAKDLFDQLVAPAKANLVLIAFGLNDAHSDIGGPPRNSPEAYKEDVRALIRASKAIDAEVILITPMQPNPWLKNGIAQRMPQYVRALVELADEEQVGCADVYRAWLAQADRGVPPFSQLHNWINHPGPDAHRVYSDTLLEFFRPEAGHTARN